MRRYLFPTLTALALAIAIVGLARAVTADNPSTATESGVLPADQLAAQQATATPSATAEPEEEGTPTPTPTPAPLGTRIVPETVEAVATPGGQLPRDLAVELVMVADGLNDPVAVVSANDGTGRLFVAERPGVVRVIDADGELLEEPFLDLTADALPALNSVLSAFLEQGLYDIEFHPDYAQNGLLYVHFAELLRNGDSMIVEYQVSAENPNVADPDSRRAIMHIEQPWANHNGGELAFGPDGYLYIGSGDGGWEGDPLEAGEDVNTVLGKLLRIDVDNTQGSQAYAVPGENPFAQEVQVVGLFGITEEEFAQIQTEGAPEILHYGLRNPWKFHFDPDNGDLYMPDVGQNEWEEINYLPADSEVGLNFGWDHLMGTHCFPIQQEECSLIGVLPIAEYSHELGNAVISLGVSRADQYPGLDGIYFAADWGSGRIWGLAPDEENSWQMEELLNTSLNVTAGGNDEDGSVYVTTCDCQYGQQEIQPGAVWQLVPEDAVPEDAETAPTDTE